MSETSKCRERLIKYCQGNGIDVGYGGDPIVHTAINIDLPNPYTKVGVFPRHLSGDGRDLYWFQDNCLDYVYSSHLLEDFPVNEIIDTFSEWLRVLKPGGYLVLYLPDEQAYRKYCKDRNKPANDNHKNEKFSLEFLKYLIYSCCDYDERVHFEIVHENAHCEDYSFELVIKKKN